jgi:hypothetical protein
MRCFVSVIRQIVEYEYRPQAYGDDLHIAPKAVSPCRFLLRAVYSYLLPGLPLRRYAPTPGFIALEANPDDGERERKGKAARERRPIRLGTRPGARVASPRCPILRAVKRILHRREQDARNRFDEIHATGYIGVAEAWRPSAVSTINGTSG